MDIKKITKKDIVDLYEKGKIIAETDPGNEKFRKTHYKHVMYALKSFEDAESLQDIIHTMTSKNLALEKWENLGTIKSYALAFSRLELYLSNHCLEENVATSELPASHPTASSDENDLNYSFDVMKKDIKEIGKLYSFLLNAVEGGLIASKKDYMKKHAKLALEELKQDVEKIISKL